MSFVIDIIIILTAVAAIYLGITRGFIKSVMGFATLLLAIIAAYIFTEPAAGWINERFVGNWINGIVSESIGDIVAAGDQQLELSKIIEDRPEALDVIAERFGFHLDEIADYYVEVLSGEPDSEAVQKLAEYIAAPTAETISRVLGALGVFLAALIVLNLITYILDLICHLPVLNTLNTLLGLLFGAGSALIAAWAISNLAVGLIRALGAIDSKLFNESVISGSIILRFFYENSLILFK